MALELAQVRQDHFEVPREPLGGDLHTVRVPLA